jgi:hypothetical protein
MWLKECLFDCPETGESITVVGGRSGDPTDDFFEGKH